MSLEITQDRHAEDQESSFMNATLQSVWRPIEEPFTIDGQTYARADGMAYSIAVYVKIREEHIPADYAQAQTVVREILRSTFAPIAENPDVTIEIQVGPDHAEEAVADDEDDD